MIRSKCKATIIVTFFTLLTLGMAVAGCVTKKGDEAGSAPVGQRPASARATFYVSPGGSDSNPGTREAPWATPGYGSKRIRGGDTLVMLGGRYSLSVFHDDMITPPSGTRDAWTIVRGEAGARPVLAGIDDLFAAADISGNSYVRLENLEITSDNGAKFRGGIEGTDKPVSHILLKDLYIHHIDDMAVNLADASDVRVEDCTITHCGFGCLGGPVGESGGWRDVVVTGCTLSFSGHYYQGGPGPSPYDRPDGFGVEPSSGPVEIVDTRAEHNRGDGLDSKCENTYIHECVVANNSCDGVKLWGDGSRLVNTLVYGTGDGEGGPSPWAGLVIGTETSGASFEVTNVTIHDNPEREAYPMYVQYDEKAPITLTMNNTIVANGNGPAYVGRKARFLSRNNLFYRPGGGSQVEANGREYEASAVESGALGPGDLSRDPMFEKPAWGTEGDYHLKPESPAIDAGYTGGAPEIDLDGNVRPADGAVDMGTYEFGATAPGASLPVVRYPL